MNIDKILFYQSLIFMFRVKNSTIPYVFYERFTDINHHYQSRFHQKNFAQRKIKLPRAKCARLSRAPSLKQYTYSQNNILTPQKQCTSQNSFKKPVKETILKLCNKFDYFSIHISMKRLAKESSTWYVHKIFRGSINYPMIRRRTSACQGVRNVAFSGRIVCILCG